jgi:hypothetical protein
MNNLPKPSDSIEEKPPSGIDALDEMAAAANAAEGLRRRYAIVFDATASMGSWWNMAQTAVKQAVDEIKARTFVPFQVKIVAYRDRVCDSMWIEESVWSDDTDELKRFISNIHSHGGGDTPESVDEGLKAVMQCGTNQVILIGDAPPRPENDCTREAYTMGTDKCPVYALYITDTPKRSFEMIARLSGGKAFPLNRASDMWDILQVLLSCDKALGITYQPKTVEGKRLLEQIGG